MKEINFSSKNKITDDLFTAYTFRYTQAPEFSQHGDYIATDVNPSHPEGFDNISLLTHERYSTGVKVSLTCEFEGLGCPEIIIVPETEECRDGVIRYGACFEIVLYKDGINVWRHYRNDGKCSWHKRLGLDFSVSENEKHTLFAEIREKYLYIEVDGKKAQLRTDDLPESFHIGLTACEGIVRLYNMTIDEVK